MERSRSNLDIIGRLQKAVNDLGAQIQTIKNQNLAMPDWVDVTVFSNSWLNFGGSEDHLGYWKDNGGIVRFRGVIKSGTVGAAAFTLPVGVRPAGNRRFPSISAGAVSGYILIDANGLVTIAAGTNTWVDLSSVSFRAEK